MLFEIGNSRPSREWGWEWRNVRFVGLVAIHLQGGARPRVFEYLMQTVCGRGPDHWRVLQLWVHLPQNRFTYVCVSVAHSSPHRWRDSCPRVMWQVEPMTTDHWTDGQQFTSHVLTAWGRRTAHSMKGHRRISLRKRVNTQELWEAGFLGTMGWCSLAPIGGCG